MKKFKKILALALSLAMVLGMSVTSLAEELKNPKPTAADTATVTVKNVETGATVTAYQIVEAKYDSAGFVEYQVPKDDEEIDKVSIVNPTAPTSDEIIVIAKDSAALATLKTVSDFTASEVHTTGAANEVGKVDYSKKLEAGYWLVLITGTTKDVYNPMLVGVYYENTDGSGNTIEGGTLDSNATWTLQGTEVYAKSTKPTIDKKIVNSDGTDSDGKTVDNGNDVAVGGDVSFQIDTVIPSYSSEYTTATVKITDVLSKGLTLNQESIKVKVNNAEVQPSGSTFTLDTSIAGQLVITFAPEYVLANRETVKNVEVTYTAKLNDEADVNFNPNTNTATLEYSNNPTNTSSTNKENDKTYTYTFAIGAHTFGENESATSKTEEIVKVDENGNLIVLESNTITDTTVNKVVVTAGAEFALKQNGDVIKTGKTDANGRLQFTGLDAGTYKLVETKAPTGYQLDQTEHDVVISAVYNTNGTLASYTIKIDNEATNTYTATYVSDSDTVDSVNKETTRTEIKNTKLASLPSTGGIGTTIFTIGGCATMILAAALYFASRRKTAK